MLLGDGSKVLVIAFTHATNDAKESQLSEVRAHALAEGAAQRPVPRAIAWGYENESGIPFVLDAGDPRSPEDRPAVIPRYDGPANVVVFEAPNRLEGASGELSPLANGSNPTGVWGTGPTPDLDTPSR